MTEALLTYETIDEEQIKDIMSGNPARVPKDWDQAEPVPAKSKMREKFSDKMQTNSASMHSSDTMAND